ncbi:hypothetical protein scyTo_0022953 [Scyliorhinus torazame]|uniref:Uncharacterized protein n=1 Tax=Scyliorhinus torazame TaxID=75743 RepID=A0A401Q6N1_SCYTO|nr:hypothetical protein [Scyliorhinus torazame]
MFYVPYSNDFRTQEASISAMLVVLDFVADVHLTVACLLGSLPGDNGSDNDSNSSGEGIGPALPSQLCRLAVEEDEDAVGPPLPPGYGKLQCETDDEEEDEEEDDEDEVSEVISVAGPSI